MEKITPHLWFDTEAKEAGTFYTSLFVGSRVKNTTTLHDTPSGSVDIVTIELAGQELTLLSAGPLFKFTPAISFLVSCTNIEEVDRLWSGLSQGGSVLMELGSYPFSERYGWTQDRYGLSWQVCPTGMGELLNDPDPARGQRAMKAMLGMKKIDVAALRAAADAA